MNAPVAAATVEIRRRDGSLIGSWPGATVLEAIANAVRSGADLRGAYLRGADLRDAYLRDANLRDAYLRGADLRGAYLRDANLRDADLGGAYLRGADLRGAYLRGADLGDADLGGAYLRGADLRDAYLRDAYLRDADLRDADLRGAYLRDANLRGAYLRDANLLPKTAAEWCALHEVAVVDGIATLYKAVGSDWRGSHRGPVVVTYEPGSTPSAPDWDGGKEECGGGLHFSPRPRAARHFLWGAAHYVACPVAVADIAVHADPRFPMKVKAPRCCGRVYEVDIDGVAVPVAAEAGP